jgi:hypothetical protein
LEKLKMKMEKRLQYFYVLMVVVGGLTPIDSLINGETLRKDNLDDSVDGVWTENKVYSCYYCFIF